MVVAVIAMVWLTPGVDVISAPGVKSSVPAAVMVVVIVGNAVMNPVEVIPGVQVGVTVGGTQVGVAVRVGVLGAVNTGVWLPTGAEEISGVLPTCLQDANQTRIKSDTNQTRKEFMSLLKKLLEREDWGYTPFCSEVIHVIRKAAKSALSCANEGI
jgi:hypothetical protein